MERKCKWCAFCARAYGGAICLLGANEVVVRLPNEDYLAGEPVNPDDECKYPEKEDTVSFTPATPEAIAEWHLDRAIEGTL